MIHINFFPAEVAEVYFPQLNVVGDIATSVMNLDAQISDRSNWDFKYYNEVKKDIESHLSKYSKDSRFPIIPQRLLNIVRDG